MINRSQANNLYLILAGIFIAALITCNLIFQKFFQIEIWLPFIGAYTFTQSVGLLPYPITFLVTDIISEIYGRDKANKVVFAGLIASVFMLLVVAVADKVPTAAHGLGNMITINSEGVEDNVFHAAFGLTTAAVFASMMAYLFAQFIDIRIFHFWKKLTKGKHLWLRNNASTIFSQLIDTFLVLFLLCNFNVIPWENFYEYFRNGFLFKVFFAAFDTPIAYAITFYLRKKFNLEFGQEINT